MRLLNHLTSGTLLLLLVELVCCMKSASIEKPANQRCFGDIFVSTDKMADLYSSTCKKCEKQIAVGSSESHAHIAFLLPPWTSIMQGGDTTMHPLMSLASVMLRRGFDVTVLQLRDPSCYFERENASSIIFSSLPCEQTIQPNNTLHHLVEKAYNLNMCEKIDGKLSPSKAKAEGYAYSLEGPYDGLDVLPPMVRSLGDIINRFSHPVNTIVAESSFAAAALIGEKMRIPVVLIARPTEVDLIAERMPVWRGLSNFFESRKRSILLGLRLPQMNMIRKSMGLAVYKMPSDYYRRATYVLIHPDYFLSRELPHNAEAVRPLVAECVVCNPSLETRPNVTVLITPLDVDYLSMRAIIRSIVVAKTALQAQEDIHCGEDSDSAYVNTNRRPTVDCELFKFFGQLTAVLLTRENHVQSIPQMLPSYITKERSHPVDSLARHPFTVVVISHCDADSHVPAAMGIPMICIARPHESGLVYNGKELVPYTQAVVSEIAKRLMHLLVVVQSSRNYTLSSKNSAAEIVARVSHISKTRNMSAMSERDVRMLLGQPIRKLSAPSPTNEFFRNLLLAIVVIVLLAGIYYANSFTRVVKQESQIYIWRRRYRWIAPYTEDIDPSLLNFTQWIASSDALHNKWYKVEVELEPKIRNGTGHHHNRRKKPVNKRR